MAKVSSSEGTEEEIDDVEAARDDNHGVRDWMNIYKESMLDVPIPHHSNANGMVNFMFYCLFRNNLLFALN